MTEEQFEALRLRLDGILIALLISIPEENQKTLVPKLAATGMSSKQIAQLLDLSASAVRGIIHRQKKGTR